MGLAAALGPGALEHAVDLGVEREQHPRPRVGGGAERPAERPLAVGPGAQVAIGADRGVAGPLVGHRVAHPPALVAQLLERVAPGALQQARFVPGTERGGGGDRLGLDLRQRPGAERIAGGGQLCQAFGRLQRRLCAPHARARLVRDEVGGAAVAAPAPDVGRLHPLGHQRPARSQHPLALGDELQQTQRVGTAEVPGLERGQDASLRRHRRLQLVEHRHRLSRGQEESPLRGSAVLTLLEHTFDSQV